MGSVTKTEFSLGTIAEKIFAGRWIAGPSIGDAMRRAKKFNALHMSAIINYIGEDLNDRRDVSEAVATNLRLIRMLRKHGIDASISLKMTQLGLRISKKLAKENYGRIVNFARENGTFVWLDAESHDTIDDTIRIYGGQVRRGGVGIALQSYLKRSERDMSALLGKKAVIRLVKGAYKESEEIAYKTRGERMRNYAALMRQLFRRAKEFTIATHDQSLIDEAMRLNRTYRRHVTYALLNGIRDRYAAKLAANGKSVAIYVPFGTKWVDYTYRRMREASNIILILRFLPEG